MRILNKKELRYYANFLDKLAKDLTKFYYSKLNKPFKVVNKFKNGYDPVTSADKSFEKFIRSLESLKNFQIIMWLVKSLV